MFYIVGYEDSRSLEVLKGLEQLFRSGKAKKNPPGPEGFRETPQVLRDLEKPFRS